MYTHTCVVYMCKTFVWSCVSVCVVGECFSTFLAGAGYRLLQGCLDSQPTGSDVCADGQSSPCEQQRKGGHLCVRGGSPVSGWGRKGPGCGRSSTGCGGRGTRWGSVSIKNQCNAIHSVSMSLLTVYQIVLVCYVFL